MYSSFVNSGITFVITNLYKLSQVNKDIAGGKEATSEDRVQEKPSSLGPSVECHYALLEFEKPVTCLPDSVVIGSRLDTDVHILFSGIQCTYISHKQGLKVMVL